MQKLECVNNATSAPKKSNTLTLLSLGLLSIALFVVGHVRGSSVFLYVGLALMAFNFSIFYNDLLCFELLYIPLVAILKLSPDGASLLSYISLLGIALFFLKKSSFSVDVSVLVIFSGLLLLVTFKEAFQHFGLTMVYIKTIITITATAIFIKLKTSDHPTSAEEMRKANLFLTYGVFAASIIGYVFMDNVRLSAFFTADVDRVGEELVSRFCGVSGDPNYYSSLIIFAIASNLFQFLHRPHFSNIIYVIILTVFGVLSLSKMFLILLIITLCLFLLAWIKNNRIFTIKGLLGTLVIAIALVIGLNFMFNSSAVQIIFARMGESSDLNEFTTGRSDTWIGYIQAIKENFEYALIGTDSNTTIVGVHLTHNTVIQIWWKLGVFGILLIASWFISAWNKCKIQRVSGSLMLLVGCIGSTMVLDMLFFEQLFWFFAFCVLSRQGIGAREWSNSAA